MRGMRNGLAFPTPTVAIRLGPEILLLGIIGHES